MEVRRGSWTRNSTCGELPTNNSCAVLPRHRSVVALATMSTQDAVMELILFLIPAIILYLIQYQSDDIG